ncbi:uncharacterized protein LOC122018724 [Zingiber officinale]|uniref:Uncharacterized protein n=1 Tax=Zingiber officinale TaxID=94328 RepID=A0A8J5FA05_ZINOF|nr:uncharacterized protein LOC122018724 [Zingiber officinale]KAG6479224.1 hypothetical protein ZIOFF_062686 [Zingiber officinale]
MAKSKRQTRPAPPAQGVFTRSRAEIFVRRTRSGLVRTELDRRSALRPLDRSSAAYDADSSAFIKDLRARRIFSPASISVEVSPQKTDVIVPICREKLKDDDGEEGEIRQRGGVVEEMPGKPDVPMEEPMEEAVKAVGQPDVSEQERIQEAVEQKDAPEEESIQKTPLDDQNCMEVEAMDESRLDVLVEELILKAEKGVEQPDVPEVDLIQCSPPDNQNIMELETVLENKADGNLDLDLLPKTIPDVPEENMFQKTPPDPQNSMENNTLNRNRITDVPQAGYGGKLESAHHTKSRPFSCSKLVRNPSSFSYRRLLPFLMNLANDNLDVKEVVSCKNYPMKEDNFMEDRKSVQNGQLLVAGLKCSIPLEPNETSYKMKNKISASPEKLPETNASPEEISQRNDRPENIAETNACPEGIQETNARPDKIAEINASLEKITETNVNPEESLQRNARHEKLAETNASPEAIAETSASSLLIPLDGVLNGFGVPRINLVDQRRMNDNEVKFESLVNNSIVESKLQCSPSCSPPAVHEALSKEFAGNMQALSCLPRKPKFDQSMLGHVLQIDRKSRPGMLPWGFPHSLERHELAPRKGIMKKHTRGCKGICLCLDCVSFRIHSDRAFDFSRKQMEQADEIILGLIKELTGLRNLVERSVGAGTSVLLQLNQELLQGACLRALRAEETAKKRCKQMFDDLRGHCRIPGPRVTFAESVEERILPQEKHELEIWERSS